MIINQLDEFITLLTDNCSIMSIDYGAKKIGIALSDKELSIAVPLCNINNDNNILNNIQDIVKKHSVCAMVLGLPLMLDSTYGEQTEIILKFANTLEFMQIPIYLQDERFTSKMADNIMKYAHIKRKNHNLNAKALMRQNSQAVMTAIMVEFDTFLN